VRLANRFPTREPLEMVEEAVLRHAFAACTSSASTALKRLNSFTDKNHFYRANRELGRIFKTEFILQFLSDPATRKRVRRGLLRGEEIHALARQVAYGKHGVLTTRDLEGQRNTSSCLTLIMACIIYWQATGRLPLTE
jgi:TnpA family transposase